MNTQCHRLSQIIQVGDLVRYQSKPGVPIKKVGIVLDRDDQHDDLGEVYFRVKWMDHSSTTRNWYRALELRKLER